LPDFGILMLKPDTECQGVTEVLAAQIGGEFSGGTGSVGVGAAGWGAA